MPHVSSASGGDDLGSTDEVKVFKDEGDGEDEKRSSENLTEEKSSLIDLTESEEKSGGSYSSSKHASRPDHSPVFGKVEPTPHTSSFNMGYLVSPYGYANGAPVSMASKMGLGPGSHPGAAALPFFCHNGEHLAAQPPPAHMGIPPYQLDTKAAGMGEYWRPSAAVNHADWKRIGPALLAASGLTRPPMYPFSPGQYPYPMLSPEMSQVASWHTPSMYPISTAATGFRSPYPTSLPIPSSSLPSDFYRFSPGLMPPHPGLSPHSHPLASHPAIVTPGPKQDLPHTTDHNHRYARSSMDQKNSSSADNKNNQDGNNANDKKKPHIKKPLNAFMLYMKEMRAKVVAECTLKESAAINQILGRRWHALGREEQAKYYELARRERQLHMQLYPDWSSRANASRGKKRKRKQETNEGGNSMKKCRARYGLEHQSQWCKPCRRKKKCIRYMETGDSNDGNHSDDNLGSCGSVGDAQSPPEDDAESINQSLSSPGGLSGLSSLTSPSMILPSPSTSLASPSVSLASPCMSLQSPLTPHDGTYDIKPLILPTTSTLSISSSHQQSTSNGSNNGNNNGNGNSDVNNYDCKPLSLPTTSSLQITSHLNHHQQPSFHNNTPHRNPVGTNPHDINNPLSVNQLTGQCIKNSNSNTNVDNSQQNGNNNNNESSRPVISVT
ncbi:protein pangolin, isoforms A/H/I/S isoform X2 [Chrysoperla carnea]|uniref:protein pangolin, isoforms A/H/I/S isoform X2 n=1 Tax=Chrysoperla carnea TaxID=189513 RepID=UPI001D07944C|nr:protein pangolin, isoforms A/H/I/S isoform X2 [Chrysoperla carnea]